MERGLPDRENEVVNRVGAARLAMSRQVNRCVHHRAELELDLVWPERDLLVAEGHDNSAVTARTAQDVTMRLPPHSVTG